MAGKLERAEAQLELARWLRESCAAGIDAIFPLAAQAGTGRGQCLLATRTVVDVMRQLKIKVQPLSVRAMVYGARLYARVEREDRLPSGPDELDRWCEEERSWSIGIGVPGAVADPGGWNGHLVALVDDRILVDLALVQAERPQHDLYAPSLAVPLPRDVVEPFLRAERRIQLGLGGTTDAGEPVKTLAMYEVRPKDRSYEGCRGWYSPEPRLVAALVRALRGDRAASAAADRLARR